LPSGDRRVSHQGVYLGEAGQPLLFLHCETIYTFQIPLREPANSTRSLSGDQPYAQFASVGRQLMRLHRPGMTKRWSISTLLLERDRLAIRRPGGEATQPPLNVTCSGAPPFSGVIHVDNPSRQN
jgi:hypothetical protein